MRIERQPAYLLHKRQYRESSLIIEVFTAEYGRLSLIAKGARRPKSPFKAALQLFTPMLINYSDRNELGTLTAAEQAADRYPLRADRLYCGYYLNELLVRLLHRHDAHEQLFRYYSQTLKQLARDTRSDKALRLFEKAFLSETGYGLTLHLDSSGQPVQADQNYLFSPEYGAQRLDAGHVNSQMVYSGKTLLALHKGEFPDGDTLKQSKFLLRSVIEQRLEHRPLKSRELFIKMRRTLTRETDEHE